MRKLSLIPAIFVLLLSVACGSGSGNSNGGGGFGSGGSNGFSNATLSGQYAYQVSGFDFASNANLPFREAGVFTADGKGKITSATDDLAEGVSLLSDPATGSYTIASDGTGSITLNFSTNVFVTFAVTVTSSSKLLLTVPVISPLGLPTGAGIALKQDTTALATVPSGNFAFGSHSVSTTQGSSAIVGAFAVNGGVVSGKEDVLRAGALLSHTLTGLFNTPDASGRGTATLTNELSATSTFNYYLVNANIMFLFNTDNGINGIGRAEKQSTASFGLSSLTGNYAFGSHGDTASLDFVNTVGRFTAGGDGTITAGAFDSVQDGTPASNVAYTGSYTLAPNGRAVLSLAPTSGSAVEQVAYLVSPARAFFLVNDTAKVEDGTFDAQSTAAFSNSSLSGTFAFLTHGVDSVGPFDRLGTMASDGAGNLKLNYVFTEPGSASQTASPTGTYSVASNGRATGSVTNLSGNLVFYLISASDGYLLQADSATEVAGSFTKQQ